MSAIVRILRAPSVQWSALALAASIALIGVAHTPFGRPLLNALRGAPGCPMALDGGDPALLETQRIAALESRRGTQREAGRYALGFELGKTSKAAVLAHLRAHAITCASMRSGSALRCTKLPASYSRGAPAIDDLHLQFDPSDRLVAIDLFRAGTDSERALRWLDVVRNQLQATVGSPTATGGPRSAAALNQYLQRAVLEYQYQGYVAQISAMNVGKRGVLVREQYQWLPGLAHAG